MATRKGDGRRPRPPPSFTVRPSAKRDAALADRMERAVTVSWKSGVTRFRQRINSDDLARAYLSGDYDKVMTTVPFRKLGDDFTDAVARIQRTTAAGAQRGASMLPKGGPTLRYDLNNPRIQEYLSGRSGALIKDVTDGFQGLVQNMMRGRFAQGLTTQTIADNLLEENSKLGMVLKGGVGLDERSAQAAANFAANGAAARDVEGYMERLDERRAEMIARTEVIAALNQGELAVWDSAAEQGVIDPETTMRVWSCDPDPCPKICAPMDGIMVGFDEEFILPQGDSVIAPPAHPSCRCRVLLQADGEI